MFVLPIAGPVPRPVSESFIRYKTTKVSLHSAISTCLNISQLNRNQTRLWVSLSRNGHPKDFETLSKMMRSSRAVVWFWDDPSAIYFFSSQRSSLEFLFWPVLAVPRSSPCRVWHTHPQGLVHGDISSHSQRNQVKITPRQKQNVMKEEQNFCEYHTKQHQFCTTLDFVSVLHKINSEYGNKILQRRLGAGEKGASFTYLFCIVVAG